MYWWIVSSRARPRWSSIVHGAIVGRLDEVGDTIANGATTIAIGFWWKRPMVAARDQAGHHAGGT